MKISRKGSELQPDVTSRFAMSFNELILMNSNKYNVNAFTNSLTTVSYFAKMNVIGLLATRR